MTLTNIDLQSKISRFFDFRIMGEKTSHPNEIFIEV